MNPGGPEGLIAAAAGSLRRARLLLAEPSPGNLNLARAALSEALAPVENVAAFLRSEGPSDRRWKDAMARLRSDLSACATLMERAAAFHAGLLDALLAAANGATASSIPARRLNLMA